VGLEFKARGSESRFAADVEGITSVLGHAGRVVPFRSHCAGLLLPGDRRSLEPMAARVQPGRVRAGHQSVHHFLAKADWSDGGSFGGVQQLIDHIDSFIASYNDTVRPFV
jgi:SRSO17 transposase